MFCHDCKQGTVSYLVQINNFYSGAGADIETDGSRAQRSAMLLAWTSLRGVFTRDNDGRHPRVFTAYSQGRPNVHQEYRFPGTSWHLTKISCPCISHSAQFGLGRKWGPGRRNRFAVLIQCFSLFQWFGVSIIPPSIVIVHTFQLWFAPAFPSKFPIIL